MRGLFYQSDFLSAAQRRAILQWLATLHPLWELRFSTHRPLPEGEEQRRLLRPVYWLGAWQFACLHYYRPPKFPKHRCVRAEPVPPALAPVVARMEKIARQVFAPHEIPKGWKLNTCLVNFYGSKREGGRMVDAARVGEHKDFEPGPVGSLSLGDRAVFQFVRSQRRHSDNRVVFQQWLDDGSLQMFGGEFLKSAVFHRVQRVENKRREIFPIRVEDFETRRVNFTFRYVPDAHIPRFKDLPADVKLDVDEYMQELAEHSSFFAREYGASLPPILPFEGQDAAPCADPRSTV